MNSQLEKAGRPKGTTDVGQLLQFQREKALIDEISKDYANAKKEAGYNKLEPNVLAMIVETRKSKHRLKYAVVPEETMSGLDTSGVT